MNQKFHPVEAYTSNPPQSRVFWYQQAKRPTSKPGCANILTERKIRPLKPDGLNPFFLSLQYIKKFFCCSRVFGMAIAVSCIRSVMPPAVGLNDPQIPAGYQGMPEQIK
jgi:hypothetical protein